jgi:hypothetical protein
MFRLIEVLKLSDVVGMKSHAQQYIRRLSTASIDATGQAGKISSTAPGNSLDFAFQPPILVETGDS